MTAPTSHTPFIPIPARLRGSIDAMLRVLEGLQAPALMAARGYVAYVFFASGLTKLRDWDTTLFLFTEEYKVPGLSPALAAWTGTAGELVLPVLLALGLTGRFAALGLSVVNLVAVVSLAEIAPAAAVQHQLWGVLLLLPLLWGPGAWSVDAWLWGRWRRSGA
jgi:putative oxidoreductase